MHFLFGKVQNTETVVHELKSFIKEVTSLIIWSNIYQVDPALYS
jgi:hypothetical protein